MDRSSRRAANRIISLYEEKARTWSAIRGREPHLEKPWLERFGRNLRPEATLLDLGCGNGWPIAAVLLQYDHHIVGVDTSGSLIREAKASLPTGEWQVADMRCYRDDRAFDGVIAWHSFFHLTDKDQRAMFPRFATFTRPGGKLLFTSGPKSEVSIGAWEGEPLFHASLSQQDYSDLLDATGFKLLQCKADDPETGGATVWLAERR